MVPSLVTQPASPYRQIRLRLSTTLRAPCFESAGQMRQSLITKKSSSCARKTRMLTQIWEACFSQKAASGMQLRSTEMRFGLRLRTYPPRVIWRGCWRQLPTRRSEMDQRLSSWPNGQNPRALGAKIAQLFYAPWLQHTLRLAALLMPRKLPNRHCRPQRSRETPLCRALSATKSRFTTLVYRIIRRRDDLTCPKSLSQAVQRCELIAGRRSSKRNLLAIEQNVFFEKIRQTGFPLYPGNGYTLLYHRDGVRETAGFCISGSERPKKEGVSTTWEGYRLL